MAATIYYKITNSVLYLRNNNVSGYNSFTTYPTVMYDPPWIENSNITSVVIENVITPDALYQFFQGLINLKNIQNISNINTANATSMMYMFNRCSSLTSLDLSSFNTSNVTNMSSMFQSCTSLKTLNISHFNTSNVKNMSYMFYGCSALESLSVSSFNTSNVTNMKCMFYNCCALESLDVSSFNTSNVTNMNNMFNRCSSLVSLDLSGFNTSNVTDMGYMFCICSALKSLDVSGFNTLNVTNMKSMFYSCQLLTSLNVSDFNTSNVTDMAYMFHYCSSLTSLDLSSFNTSNVTDMKAMFQMCALLTSLDISSFDTSKVTDMSYMFKNCYVLTSLDVSDFNTSNVTNMRSMFSECYALTFLDVSGFDTSKVTDMAYMLDECYALTSPLDVSGFNTSNVTDMEYMFGHYALASLDVSGFDTSNVTNMSCMFYNCQALTTLNLSSFNASNVTDMSSMFFGCRALTGIIEINANPSNLSNMFTNTVEEIYLIGSSTLLNAMAATANNNNVKAWSLTIQPMAERDDTNATQINIVVDIIRIMYVDNAPITISVYRDNSQTPLSLTWDKSLIMDENSKRFTTSVNNIDELISTTFTFSVSDQYGTSANRTITVPTNYYTLDFLDGGKEISFGEMATENDLEQYQLLYTQPLDWSGNWTSYYKIVNNEYTHVTGNSAPTFAANTYYRKIDSLFKCRMDTSFNDMDSDEIAGFLSDLDISGSELETTQADWIVEQGTNGIWTWRKWQSGIAECWGDTGEITLTNYTTVGTFLYGYSTSVQFPTNLFVSKPIVTYSAYVGSGFALTGTETLNISASAVTLYALCTSTGSKPTTWQVSAKGRWK